MGKKKNTNDNEKQNTLTVEIVSNHFIMGKKENTNDNEKQNTLTVEIVSNHSLLEILSDWGKVWKITGALLVLVFTIFIALAFVTISIKRIYPYNDIKVNAFGATTMQKEDVEIIYWLFNTAELWANSGIEVKEGDILTIRASGKYSTALHHVVNEAMYNENFRYPWIGVDGENPASIRSKYRIFENKNKHGLLMQVVPSSDDVTLSSLKDSAEIIKYEKRLRFDYVNYKKEKDELENKKNYYYIGAKRENLQINSDGRLHFAVNDVVLTDNVIKNMISENLTFVVEQIAKIKKVQFDKYKKNNLHEIKAEYKDSKKQIVSRDTVIAKFDSIKKNLENLKLRYGSYETAFDSIKKKEYDYTPEILKELNQRLGGDTDFIATWRYFNEYYENALQFGAHPDSIRKSGYKNAVAHPFSNEMTYYLEKHYYNVWFDDNIGSFLIVIERKKGK